jgi:hypothetical protein
MHTEQDLSKAMDQGGNVAAVEVMHMEQGL